ncbi:hypothetical protein JW859_00005 [bacterium]|nr:hypothetical protein [bacterium]
MLGGVVLLWLLLSLPALAGDDEQQDDPYDGKWAAELGAVRDLNAGEPVLVKALFRDFDGNLMDVEKVYVRWEWINETTGRWIVLSGIDTYMKCLVEYDAGDCCFRDPCYGSEYDLEGHVTKKPAKEDLADYSDLAVQEGEKKEAHLVLLREPEK